MILGLSIRNLLGYCPASKHGKKCVYSEDPKYFFNLLVPIMLMKRSQCWKLY